MSDIVKTALDVPPEQFVDTVYDLRFSRETGAFEVLFTQRPAYCPVYDVVIRDVLERARATGELVDIARDILNGSIVAAYPRVGLDRERCLGGVKRRGEDVG